MHSLFNHVQNSTYQYCKNVLIQHMRQPIADRSFMAFCQKSELSVLSEPFCVK